MSSIPVAMATSPEREGKAPQAQATTTQYATALAPNPTITITSLSPELQMLLFECMTPEDAVCLSLTNKSSWECLKAAYPNSFPFKFVPPFVSAIKFFSALPPSPLDNLHLRLRTWMEPRILEDLGGYKMKQEFRERTKRKKLICRPDRPPGI